MSNNKQEIQIITEKNNDNADYLKNRTSITIMDNISNVFYGLSILSIVGMFIYFFGTEYREIENVYIQVTLFSTFISSIFIFFSFGKLFEVVSRIDKNTKK